jgi:hypothetical protein
VHRPCSPDGRIRISTQWYPLPLRNGHCKNSDLFPGCNYTMGGDISYCQPYSILFSTWFAYLKWDAETQFTAGLNFPASLLPLRSNAAFLKAQRWRCICNFRVRPVHPTSMPLIIILVLLLLLFGGGGYYMGPGLGYYGGGGLSIVLLIIILFLLFGRGRSRL